MNFFQNEKNKEKEEKKKRTLKRRGHRAGVEID